MAITKMANSMRALAMLEKSHELNAEYVAQRALGEGKAVYTTNMHSKPKKTFWHPYHHVSPTYFT